MRDTSPKGLPGLGKPVGLGSSAAVSFVGAIGYSSAEGTWVELIAATTAESHWLTFATGPLGDGVTHVSVDIGVGAAASEVAIVTNYQAAFLYGRVLLPLRIPAGSRVAMRMSSTNATQPAGPVIYGPTVMAAPTGDRRRSPTFLTTVGVTAGAGVTANTNDTYVEVVASTPHAAQGLVVGYGVPDSTYTTTVATVTVGVGASGSEQVYGQEMVTPQSAETFQAGLHAPLVGSIPQGSRLAMKHSAATVNQTAFSGLLVPYS